jgi:hypothetical protein
VRKQVGLDDLHIHDLRHTAACDQLETREGAGPCIAAMTELHSVLIEDVDAATECPNWRQAALDNGFRSFVAFPGYVNDNVTVGATSTPRTDPDGPRPELVAVDRYVQELADAFAHRRLTGGGNRVQRIGLAQQTPCGDRQAGEKPPAVWRGANRNPSLRGREIPPYAYRRVQIAP